MPNGIFILPDFCTFKKFTKMPWAVSGLRYKSIADSADAPSFVPNIKLNCLTSVQFLEPDSGHAISNSSINALTSSRFSSPRDFAIRDKISFFRARYSTTRVFVVTNSSRLKASPKRTAAFSISFSAF